jgi:hypothetical protein
MIGVLPAFAVEGKRPVCCPRLENQLAPFAIARVTLVRVYPKNPIGVVQETATDAIFEATVAQYIEHRVLFSEAYRMVQRDH